jgi:ABC-type transport system substrate-binding protein
MTFKVLPRDLPVNSEEFAKKPVSSGPFFLDSTRRSDEERECMFFVANPSYGIRPGKRDLPRIQEVRFYVCADPLSDLRNGKLDLVLDLTAKEAADLLQKGNELQVTVPLPSATTPNRRIYFLAVNQRNLPDLALRKALAHAINREALLDKHFRRSLQSRVHKALNGPFPVGSWASNPAPTDRPDKGATGLFDAEKAKALSSDPAVRKAIERGPLKLKYPEGDPVLADALTDLVAQVKSATGLVLELVPCDPYLLRQDVEQAQSYDLAYYHYDFPDETYWLWPLLGPYGLHGKIDPSSPDGNFLNFTDDKLQSLLREATGYRDFAKVREYQQKVHDNLMKLSMPFIPLWQLDPLLAIHRDVKPAALDPALVFTNIAEWRLERK